MSVEHSEHESQLRLAFRPIRAAIIGGAVGTVIALVALVLIGLLVWGPRAGAWGTSAGGWERAAWVSVWAALAIGVVGGAWIGRRRGGIIGASGGLAGALVGSLIGGYFAIASGEVWKGIEWATMGGGYGLLFGLPAEVIVAVAVSALLCLVGACCGRKKP
jgi:hypothetical protein